MFSLSSPVKASDSTDQKSSQDILSPALFRVKLEDQVFQEQFSILGQAEMS